MQYVVDSVRRRHIIILGHTDPKPVTSGVKDTAAFCVAKVDVEGVRPSRLATAGLLTASLINAAGDSPADGDEEVAQLNMVVQVESVKRSDGSEELRRTIFDPLG